MLLLRRSDEEDVVCNLWPETGCKSWKGRRHIRCETDGKCVEHEEECTAGNTKCPDGGDLESGGRFRCSSGMCIGRDLACDGIKQCDDGTDEGELI